MTNLSNLWRQKTILASILYLLDQLEVGGDGYIVNFDDLDTMKNIFMRWNTKTYEAILEADKYEYPR